MEKGVKEDWDVVKDVAKEDWEVVKEEAREDWNKFDLDWNKIPPSDSEREEAGGTESEGKKRSFYFSFKIVPPRFRR